MLLASPLFLFAFLPLVVIAFHMAPGCLRSSVLLLASLVFYAWGEPVAIFLLLLSIGMNHGAGLLTARFRTTRTGLVVMAACVAVNVGILAALKYGTFIVENSNVILAALSLGQLGPVTKHQILGISFFTFKALSYVLDVYRGTIPVEKNIFRTALYISFFPHILAGPIARYQEMLPGMKSGSVTPALFLSGIERLIVGLAKKMLIANPLGGVADEIFQLAPENLTFAVSWLGCICYTLQIYFDFSGYSDMAIGVGRMVGISIGENFQYPYVATSIRDFWRRWHISLSTWFRDYLYIPLGGNRAASWRVQANLFIVFFLCGLWHGASWTFVIWGMIHGICIVVERIGLDRVLAKAWRPLRHGYVLLVVAVAWVFFRAPSLIVAVEYVKAMAGLGSGDGVVYYPALYLTGPSAVAMIIGVVGSLPLWPWLMQKRMPVFAAFPRAAGFVHLVFMCAVFVISLLHVAASTYNPFIYFQF